MRSVGLKVLNNKLSEYVRLARRVLGQHAGRQSSSRVRDLHRPSCPHVRGIPRRCRRSTPRTSRPSGVVAASCYTCTPVVSSTGSHARCAAPGVGRLPAQTRTDRRARYLRPPDDGRRPGDGHSGTRSDRLTATTWRIRFGGRGASHIARPQTSIIRDRRIDCTNRARRSSAGSTRSPNSSCNRPAITVSDVSPSHAFQMKVPTSSSRMR